MNHHHPVSESATLARAAKHLIQNHGSQAAAVAAKRAIFLEQCGEIVGADTWRKIGVFVQAIETTGKLPPITPEKPDEIAKAPPPERLPVRLPGRLEDEKGVAILQEWPRPRETPVAPALGQGVIGPGQIAGQIAESALP
jgi:hypothetical protein